MRDLVIFGGRVVLESEILTADIVVREGRVAGLEEPGRHTHREADLIDAGDRFVMPGGVDVHTHVALAFGETSTRDDFASASRAAAMGGTTTFLEFAIPYEGESPVQALERRFGESAEVTHVDYGFHGCITRVDGKEDLEDIERLAHLGVNSIKVFTAYRNLVMLELGAIRDVMETATASGLLVMVHAETESIVDSALRNLTERGMAGARYQALSRPPLAEVDAATSILRLAEETGGMVYLVHVTLPEVADAIAEARRRGVDAFGESCPHYLLLDDQAYRGEHPERLVCSPPLRSRTYASGLWDRFGDGLFGIHSDHCCFDSGQKAEHADDLSQIPPGLPGIETRYPLMISEALRGTLGLTDVVRLCSTQPARLFGLVGKGTLLPGSDADIVIVDPRAETVVEKGMHMETDYSPFDGWTLQGRIETVLARGRPLITDGSWNDLPPAGRLISRHCSPRSGVPEGVISDARPEVVS